MKKLNKKGFSIVEIFAVVAVIGITTGIGLFVQNRISNRSSKAESVSVSTRSGNPTCRISSSKNPVSRGEFVQITWSSTNSYGGNITGIGKVAKSGSARVQVNSTKTYTGSFGGTTRDIAVTCQTTVSVTTTPVPTCALSANPNTITPGGSTTLSWTSTNATTFTISGLGAVTPNIAGSRTVQPTTTTNYSATVSGANSSAASTCSVIVTVTAR